MPPPASSVSSDSVTALAVDTAHARAAAVTATLPPAPPVAAHTRPAWAMPERWVHRFLANARIRRYPAGAPIVHEGDPADSVYLMLDGTARGYVTDSGPRQLVLGDVGPGEYFGETTIDGGARCTSGVAVTDARIAIISRAAFLAALAEDSDFALHLMRKFSLRVRAMTEFVRRLALADAQARVLLFLREMAVAQGDIHAPLAISQQAIGNRVGATRSMVNRVLKALGAEGIVTVTPAGITLRRLPARLPDTVAHRDQAAPVRGARAAAMRGVVNPPTLAPTAQRFTAPLPPDLIALVQERGRTVHYVPGMVVAHEGAPADAFCLIVRGRLLASLTNGADRVFHLGELRAGEYVGENMVVPHGVWVSRLSAIERSELVQLAPDAFFALLHERPDFAKHLLVKLAQRLRTLTHQTKRLALMDVIERTRTLLLELSTPAAGGLRLLPAGLSQQAISDRVGASRTMINRVMRDLQAEGFVVALEHGLAVREQAQACG